MSVTQLAAILANIAGGVQVLIETDTLTFLSIDSITIDLDTEGNPVLLLKTEGTNG